ncbi:hypothetical protein D7Y27_19975 [Corallococcus sp. AB004]|uniref:hypothetical protein n=1 Tax=Corallococcus TaxID=83461 RepID=UPI000EA2404F|nr:MULTISPECIES: hypothetical protein [Corallococcus]NPD24437.1 hypothetical protein [Corallococcus exiguus]NRD44459.1 hypothetical protein [Corallococcus exiguus]RKH95681.1 hypothetical protein D7Y04_32230 [Corallococcus sp. AB038B]RKI40687.1 hypothetical protein D7Y27_19975 [Corallococcus sp. AB004]
MLLRGFAMFAVVSIFGMGCGGAEVTDGAESDMQAGQVSAELATSCETLQTRRCNPGSETSCQWANGTFGECFCQEIPFNKWVCLGN